MQPGRERPAFRRRVGQNRHHFGLRVERQRQPDGGLGAELLHHSGDIRILFLQIGRTTLVPGENHRQLRRQFLIMLQYEIDRHVIERHHQNVLFGLHPLQAALKFPHLSLPVAGPERIELHHVEYQPLVSAGRFRNDRIDHVFGPLMGHMVGRQNQDLLHRRVSRIIPGMDRKSGRKQDHCNRQPLPRCPLPHQKSSRMS
ncbi:hypothetical protein SDC9_125890 [bioreactor metagenome]|uniref:Uncharacterized protein n=1 Tax=bioreactor metagenome TaxID=1076179 RepID=A0A645CPP8_9ZZZZ